MVVRFVCEECVPCARVCPLEPRVVSRRPPVFLNQTGLCDRNHTYANSHSHIHINTKFVKGRRHVASLEDFRI